MNNTHGGRVHKITVIRRLAEDKYEVQVNIHRKITRTYLNPMSLPKLYKAIGKYSSNINMVSIGRSVITVYYIGERNVLL